ncbi:MAG: hypothetical protein EPN55_05810 [Gammaproteobacteria bacterium]|nr:MAG: hypothetical protein EPN55_05810 [Gammaproteobacteria bacterium]
MNPMQTGGHAPCVEPSPVVVNLPTKSPEKNRTPRTALAHFRGFDAFAAYAHEKLGRYDLPDTRTRLTAEGLRRWLPQLELSERQYARLVGMSVEESAKHNAHWPLVSWLGVVVEMQESA